MTRKITVYCDICSCDITKKTHIGIMDFSRRKWDNEAFYPRRIVEESDHEFCSMECYISYITRKGVKMNDQIILFYWI